jgi:hypothetical protein
MIQGLYSVEEVTELINKGKVLLLAGDAALLSQLPKGKWIAGTTHRFVSQKEGLLASHEKIFVHCLPDYVDGIKISVYDASTIKNIYDDAYDNGFSVLIMTWDSEVLREYSTNVSSYSNFACKVVCGWITSAFFPGDKVQELSLAVSGEDASFYDSRAVVMHVSLPSDKYAEVHTFSPFKQGKGDTFVFEENGMTVKNAYINGVKRNFKEYLNAQPETNATADVPVAGDFVGTIMNVYLLAFRQGHQPDLVYFTAPVYKNIEYRMAELDMSYEEPSFDGEIVFSLTCITNFLKPEVFQKFLTKMNGPFTYGEIAYHLMNHATIYLTIGNTLY